MKIKYSFHEVKQTHGKSDSWWAILWRDRVNFPLVYFLANYTNVSPNTVTMLSILFGLLAGYFYFLGTAQTLIAGAILFEISYILDGVDGKLARLTQRESGRGGMLDKVRDKIVHIACFLGLTLGQFFLYNDVMFLTLGSVYFLLLAINSAVSYLILHKKTKQNRLTMISSSSALESMKPIKLLGRNAYPIPGMLEWTAILFIFSAFLNQVILGFYIADGLLLFSVFYVAKRLKAS